jgi:hypothetical protein
VTCRMWSALSSAVDMGETVLVISIVLVRQGAVGRFERKITRTRNEKDK